ncbi:MAG TPA: MarR family winged helix-turn-helix transcriptional regulator [Terriglobales bacterium]|nr:MarR family winged helix-turn-helix transcriptional regulator [Terriglobales bacterium]
MSRNGEINQSDYEALAEFRYQIRRFLRFSERAARSAGIEPQQHQLMLVVKGMPEGTPSTISEIAERLQIQHHSTVELVDRLVARGLVSRKRGSEDRRQVMVQLTAKGEKLLRDLSLHHRDELKSAGADLVVALRKLMSSLGKPAKTPKKGSAARKS